MRIARFLPGLIAPALRPALVAAAIVFLTAVVTTQIALYVEGRESDARLRQLGAIYLDGLVAAAGTGLATRDGNLIAEHFASALAVQHGIKERALFAFDGQRELLARAGESAISVDEARVALGASFRIDSGRGIAWASRRVGSEPASTLVAALDVRELVATRARTMLGIFVLDLLIATLAGILAHWAVKWLNRPFETLTVHLEKAELGQPEPIPQHELHACAAQVRSLYVTFNRMLNAARERERLAGELADQSQSAALGRLAATIAHEVRNPLAGLTTAVSTLRRFGERREVREESLGFLERGLEALDRIVTSTLNIYRPENERQLMRADFDDMERLVRPAAERARVALDWDIDVPGLVSIGAVGVRQVLLNLLLNACAATPTGGRVGLRATIEERALVCIITDQGRGMLADRSEQLSDANSSEQPSRRIGMDVVIALLGGLDGRVSITSIPEKGTTVRVSIPLRDIK